MNHLVRPFNPKMDKIYGFDETPDLYLEDEQIEEAFSSLPQNNTSEAMAVKQAIIKIETLKREYCKGLLSFETMKQQVSEIDKVFFSKFGYWMYVSSVHQSFYNFFDSTIK